MPEAWRCFMKLNAATDRLSVPDLTSKSHNDILWTVSSNWRRNSLRWPSRVYGSLFQSSPSNISVATLESSK